MTTTKMMIVVVKMMVLLMMMMMMLTKNRMTNWSFVLEAEQRRDVWEMKTSKRVLVAVVVAVVVVGDGDDDGDDVCRAHRQMSESRRESGWRAALVGPQESEDKTLTSMEHRSSEMMMMMTLLLLVMMVWFGREETGCNQMEAEDLWSLSSFSRLSLWLNNKVNVNT